MRRPGRALAAATLAGAAAALWVRGTTAAPRPGHRYLAGAPLLFAHRGGSALAPENTVVAFERALAWWGADVLELDVHATRDGALVVIHDDTVDRTTDGTGPVAGFTLAELQRLDAGYRFTADGGRTHPFRGTGVRVPTLEEVLERFPGARVNIEVKSADAQAPLWSLIHGTKVRHRVLVAAGARRNRRRFRDYRGATSAAREELLEFYAHHLLHATARYRPVVDAFQVPEHHRGYRVLSRRFVEEAHRMNVAVHVWTVDDEADMRRLLSWGVDGVMTDRPDLLARVMHEELGRPLPPGPPPEAHGG